MYQQLHELFVNSSFNEEELTVVWQSINRTCHHYCVPAHTGIAAKMMSRRLLKLCVTKPFCLTQISFYVRHYQLSTVRNRHVLAAPLHGEQQVLEIILGLSQVISNSTNHIANTPVDGAFKIRLKK
jgi:hypothetical protein